MSGIDSGRSITRRGYLVRGRVQGVGFRWWTARLGERLGIAGTVRNTPDGAVEVMVEGVADVLADFAGKLHDGPLIADVEAIEVIECTLPSDVSGFTILK